MDNFEEILSNMTKPAIPDLKHTDLLANDMQNARDKSVVSLWWISIPLYIVAALIMKSFYMPQASFLSLLHDVTAKKAYTGILLFIILPIVLIISNLLSIKRIYFLSGNPKTSHFLRLIYPNLLIIIISVTVIIIYWL